MIFLSFLLGSSLSFAEQPTSCSSFSQPSEELSVAASTSKEVSANEKPKLKRKNTLWSIIEGTAKEQRRFYEKLGIVPLKSRSEKEEEEDETTPPTAHDSLASQQNNEHVYLPAQLSLNRFIEVSSTFIETLYGLWNTMSSISIK